MRFGLYPATLILFLSAVFAKPSLHPLDPMSWQEYWTVLEVLQSTGRLDSNTRFSIINLKEPAKSAVKSWKEGDAVSRVAYALVRQKEKSFEAEIDLVNRRVNKWSQVEGAQPTWLFEELSSVDDLVKEHPEFIEAMKRRGVEDFTFLNCDAIPPGYFGTEEEQGRRLGHFRCVDARRVRNPWPRQIEGLTVVVDMTEEKVVRVVDEGVVPLPDVFADFDQAAIGKPRDVGGPIRIDQPQGAGFQVNGHVITWQNWSFHARPDQRVGMILSLVQYRDGDRQRSVLYQGHLSEIFVPYMDPSFAWYARNFLDAGEFSFGGISKPMLRGQDCPSNAYYIDALVSQDNGRPKNVPDVICVFERYAGDMAWRHWDEQPESRPKRDLVVRTAAVLGNYDYVFDWVFQQNGSIQVAVGATGIAESKVVSARSARQTPASNESSKGSNGTNGSDLAPPGDAYGRFVDEYVVAVNHDHYFNFRLDLDVDGADNSLQIDRLKTIILPEDHPRRSLWVSEPVIARTEAQAKLNVRLDSPALWRVISSGETNHVGYPTSYQIMPGKNANTLLSSDDYPKRRAGFIAHHLWVTPFAENERYAAGAFPTLSEPGQGLPAWTQADRPIENQDIVVWYTVGMHHMVRNEDWPVMPVLWHFFELRAFDFFDRNPALDLPLTP